MLQTYVTISVQCLKLQMKEQGGISIFIELYFNSTGKILIKLLNNNLYDY